MGSIIVLPQEVSQKIAAGEVIEGPYSVVRELVDNSLDAGAGSISVVTNNGGKDFIEITDDGTGMSEEDALLSVQKHTTSKIRTAQDLSDVRTMGFRGEALSSICTVSEFIMVTKREEDPHGTKVVCKFGSTAVSEPRAANRGTAITVRNLFGNLPARRKFLKSNRAETAKMKDQIIKKSLCFHERGFLFMTDDRTVLRLQPVSDPRERIGDIFGADVAESLTEAQVSEQGYSLKLFLSNRTRTLQSRMGQYFFVNRRPVSDRALLAAVGTPSRSFFPAGSFPYLFLFIEIDPELIDINVHPQKKEIRIKIMQRLFSSISGLVRESLDGRDARVQYVKEAPPLYDQTPVTNTYVASYREAERPGVGGLLLPNQEELSLAEISQLQFRGALFRTYLLFEAADYALMVDQHAAHERVLYEKYKKQHLLRWTQKNLLIPITFTPPRNCYGTILEALSYFSEAGIHIEPFGEESFAVVQIPGIIPDPHEEETVSLVLEEFCSGNLRPATEEISDRFVKTAACRAAIKEGDILAEQEALRLLSDLSECEVPYMCPHGRPTLIRRNKGYIERLFQRR